MHKSNWIPAILTLVMVCIVSYALLVDGKPDCKQEQLAAIAYLQSVLGNGC